MFKTKGKFKFVLVFVDIFFPGWMEAYPTKTEKATEVSNPLLKKLSLDLNFLIAFKVAKDHHLFQKSSRRQDSHYRFNGNYMHLQNPNL